MPSTGQQGSDRRDPHRIPRRAWQRRFYSAHPQATLKAVDVITESTGKPVDEVRYILNKWKETEVIGIDDTLKTHETSSPAPAGRGSYVGAVEAAAGNRSAR